MEINRTGAGPASIEYPVRNQEAVAIKLKSRTWALVCDSRNFLLLENNGDEDVMDQRVVAHDETVNPATSDEGADRPGRFAISSDRRGTTRETDWHRLGEPRFA
jgi:protein required for attachment to host cells